MSTEPPTQVSVAGLLADRRRRWLLRELADAADAQPFVDLAARAGDEQSVRGLRDALRSLRDAGVVRQVPVSAGTAGGWTLAPAGAELAHLARLLTRIAVRLLELPDDLPERLRDDMGRQVMEDLADPVVVAVVRALVVAPRFAGELEVLCAPVAPRRTVYRRLSRLVEVGVLERHVVREVPRRTRYEIADRWRPAALILLLATWWEWRHADPAGAALASDLEALVHAVAPLIEPPAHLEGRRVRWRVVRPEGSRVLAVEVRDGRLRVATVPDPDAGRDGDPEVVGDPPSWCAALVSRDGSAMTVHGDRDVAAEMTRAVRSALMAPLRR